jgi:magnesium transporter
MSILRDEHLQDLHQMAGIVHKTEVAQDEMNASPLRRALYRLPWLLVGMVGSAVATATMAGFEGALARNISVAFFVPAIVYLADAVGTQSEAIAVRGLSLTRVSLRPVLGELSAGVMIGATLGLIAYVMVRATFGDPALSLTVAIALFGASGVATTIGFLLPWTFSRLGYDPALGSGPLGTVIQDVLSLLIYFLVASILVF